MGAGHASERGEMHVHVTEVRATRSTKQRRQASSPRPRGGVGIVEMTQALPLAIEMDFCLEGHVRLALVCGKAGEQMRIGDTRALERMPRDARTTTWLAPHAP